MPALRILLAPLAAAAVIAATAASAAADGPGHIVLAGNRAAVATSGHPGTPVRVRLYSPASSREDWDFSQSANEFGAGEFFWAPGGMQTDDYLAVTAHGARLVSGAPAGTVFDPVAVGPYTVLAIPIPDAGPSRNVLTDEHGRLVIAAEPASGPDPDQEWATG
jgi:hypothetical protein